MTVYDRSPLIVVRFRGRGLRRQGAPGTEALNHGPLVNAIGERSRSSASCSATAGRRRATVSHASRRSPWSSPTAQADLLLLASKLCTSPASARVTLRAIRKA